MSDARTRRVLDEAGGAHAMTGVIAIMLFLTVLAAALGLATRSAAASIARDLAGRATVQVAAASGVTPQALVAALRADPAVRRATAVDRADLAALLAPWLGEDGADPDLPLPLPILVDVDLRADAGDGLPRLRATLARIAPGARIDAQAAWMSPVTGFLSLMTWLAFGLVVLTATATAAVVVLAARAGLDAHRATIEVMHMLGATDVQVARLFQRRIARDAAVGGALGAAAAAGVVLLVAARARALDAALVAGAGLSSAAWVLLAAIPIAFVALAMIAARVTITRALGRVL